MHRVGKVRAAFGPPFLVGSGSRITKWLTALMRGVILIQPRRCKPFGPALDGEARKPPAAHTRSKWDGEGSASGAAECQLTR
jgi:hypothetical protein